MRLFPGNSDVAVPTNVLNNMARIIFQSTPITANQHRDLENLFALLLDAGVIINEGE